MKLRTLPWELAPIEESFSKPRSLALLPVLGVAAAIRFVHLTGRGLLYWDEGKFSLEGIRLLSVLHALPSLSRAGLAGKAVGTAKPTHALIIALSYALLGIRDYAPLLVDAAASTAQIAILFLLARRMLGTRIALLAAALLAVSGYDIVYARSALSESDADFFFLAGVALWWWRVAPDRPAAPRHAAWARVPAGFMLGLAFTTNYRLLVYLAVLIAIDLTVVAGKRSWRELAEAAVGWALSIALVPAVWEGIGLLFATRGVILFRSEITGRPSSYLAEALYQLHGGKQAALRFDPLPYIRWYVARQGVIPSLLLLLGLGAAVIRRSFPLVVAALLVLLPAIIFLFAPFIVPRNLDALLPFAALLAAAGLSEMLDRLRLARYRSLRVVVLAAVLALVVRDWPLTDLRSGYAAAAQYVNRHGGSGAIVLDEVSRFYLRDRGEGCDAPRLPGSRDGLLALAHDGYHYAVIDRYNRHLARYLARHARPVARYPVEGIAPFSENLIAAENGPAGESGTGLSATVTVYSLDHLPFPASLERLARHVKPGCSLDQLA